MSAENFNPVYLLSPLGPLIFSFVLVFYWRARRSFRWVVLLYALLAYGLAIIVKTILQDFTAYSVVQHFGSVSVVTGLYYGLQTSIFEVGLAYLVAGYAMKRDIFREGDAEAYGLSLSFWENGVLLGLFSFISFLSSYMAIAYGGQGISDTLSSELLKSQPSLFYGTFEALPLVGLSILERVSSLLAHFSWGFLVLVAASRKKVVYFLIAFPMGLIDGLVPFATSIGIVWFELIIFALSLIFLAVALYVKKRENVETGPAIKEPS